MNADALCALLDELRQAITARAVFSYPAPDLAAEAVLDALELDGVTIIATTLLDDNGLVPAPAQDIQSVLQRLFANALGVDQPRTQAGTTIDPAAPTARRRGPPLC